MELDFLKVFSWLNYYEPSQLGQPLIILARQLQEAAKNNNLQSTQELIEKITGISDLNYPDSKSNSGEIAESRLNCAVALYQIHRYPESLKYIREASSRYIGHKHKLAVVEWMLGCLYWNIEGCDDDALSTWGRSIDLFQNLYDHTQNGKRANQYKEWLQVQRSFMDKKLIEKKKSIPHPNLDGSLGLFRLFTEIPVGKDPGLENHYLNGNDVLVQILIINGVKYKIVYLKDQISNVVQLNLNQKIMNYIILRVIGDSMNGEGIDDGNYVLLEIKDYGYDGDIVAVEIQGEDIRATLKKIVFKDGKIILKSNSNNPKHSDQTFFRMNEGFKIKGSVVAILRPE